MTGSVRPFPAGNAPGTSLMWKLTIEDDQANRTVVPLARDEYSIGRGEENTVRLTERNISRRHARIARDAERWVVCDTGS